MTDKISEYTEQTWRELVSFSEANGRRLKRLIDARGDVECWMSYDPDFKRRFVNISMPVKRGLRSVNYLKTKGLDVFTQKDESVNSLRKTPYDVLSLSPVNADMPVFIAFSKNISELVCDNHDRIDLPQLINARLNDWREMLSPPSSSAPSRNETIGLIGELLFIRDVLLSDKHGIELEAAVNSWMGPVGESKDFQLGRTAVELKTTTSYEHGGVKIASYRQLDNAGFENLFLCVTKVSEDESGESLLEIVESLKERLRSHPESFERFTAFVRGMGWTEKTIFEAPADLKFKIDNRTYYVVKEGFPRYTTAHIVAGTITEGYEILTSGLIPFQVPEASVIETIKVTK